MKLGKIVRNANIEIMTEMLNQMPEEKKESLKKALNRNLILTSSYVLSWATITVYKEGWLVKFDGTRCSFSVFAKDNDGEFEFIRKPVESKLHKLYEQSEHMSESYFYDLAI